MLQSQMLLFFLKRISILLFMLQSLVDCAPVSSQKDEKKRQNIAKVRNHLNATEVRLKNLRKSYYGRMRSQRNARKDGITTFNSNKEEWMRVDRKQIAINGSLNRHRLIARLMDDPKIGDHFNSRADDLQIKHDKLQKHKDNLKTTGTQDGFDLNDHIFKKHYNAFTEEERKCETEIRICSKYLSNHDPNHAKKGTR